MNQCINASINESTNRWCMHACLPAWLAFFFRGQSLSLSLPVCVSARLHVCPCMFLCSLSMSGPFLDQSHCLRKERCYLWFMIYLWYLLAALVSRFLLERRCTGILGFGRLAGFLLSKERETSNQTRVLLRSITSNCGILDDRKRLHSWCFLGSCLDTVHVLVLLK